MYSVHEKLIRYLDGGSKRVLIIEQASDVAGHHLNSDLVQAFAPLGCEIVVAVPNTVPESAQFKIYLSPHQSLFGWNSFQLAMR
jgi:hypothetical protein